MSRASERIAQENARRERLQNARNETQPQTIGVASCKKEARKWFRKSLIYSYLL